MVSGAEDLSPVLTAVQFQTSYLNIIVPLFSYLQIGGREIALVSQEKTTIAWVCQCILY